MLLLQGFLYDFGLFLLQVVIFREEMVEDSGVDVFFFGEGVDGVVAFSDDIVVKSFFEVACPVGFLLASQEIVVVVIDILLDKAVDELSLAAKLGIINHGVDDMLALLGVVVAIRVEVGDKL